MNQLICDSFARVSASKRLSPRRPMASFFGFLRELVGSNRLARLWLGMGLALMANSCLDSPPTYSQAEQVPPFIITAQVTPDLNALVELQLGQPQQFVVPFLSVDVGEDLEGNVYLDRDPGQPGSWRSRQVVPAAQGGFDDPRPPVAFKFTPRSGLDAPGCHTLTLILAHQSQWDFVELPQVDNPVRLPIDDTRAASVTWWLQIKGDPGQTLRECPTLGETVP
jgi:hypothetical protein